MQGRGIILTAASAPLSLVFFPAPPTKLSFLDTGERRGGRRREGEKRREEGGAVNFFFSRVAIKLCRESTNTSSRYGKCNATEGGNQGIRLEGTNKRRITILLRYILVRGRCSPKEFAFYSLKRIPNLPETVAFPQPLSPGDFSQTRRASVGRGGWERQKREE